MEITRRTFHNPEEVIRAAASRISQVQQQGDKIDFVTFVPDGEPTLDIHLGEEIEAIQKLGYPVAVISNASLITDKQVRLELSKADWVSLKVDSPIEEAWRMINRPHGKLVIDQILNGILSFSLEYHGELVTETMLVEGINDNDDSIHALVSYLETLQPIKAYLSIPTRPPMETWVKPPSLKRVQQIGAMIAAHIPVVELLTSMEEGKFVSTGNLSEDILGITAVHPLREDALQDMLKQAGQDRHVINDLIQKQFICKVLYRGHSYYIHSGT
jgi:wyosine [tRNA(Phe)-imidazoG37] synthetase (radical SAM superfamily)